MSKISVFNKEKKTVNGGMAVMNWSCDSDCFKYWYLLISNEHFVGVIYENAVLEIMHILYFLFNL